MVFRTVKDALDIHKINGIDDFYSLKLAIKYNHLNIVKYLIERFSSTENAYKWEKAAKDYANEFNNREVLNYLLYRE